MHNFVKFAKQQCPDGCKLLPSPVTAAMDEAWRSFPLFLGYWNARMPGSNITAMGAGDREADFCMRELFAVLTRLFVLCPDSSDIPSWPSHVHCKPPLFILSTIFLIFLLSLSFLNNQPCLKYQHQLGPALPAATMGVAAHKDKFRLCFGLATWGLLNFTQVHQNAESAPACKRVSFYRAYVHLKSIKT